MKKVLIFLVLCLNVLFANNASLLNLSNVNNDWKAEVSLNPPVNVEKTMVTNGKESKEVIFNTDIDTMIYFLIDTSLPMKQSFKKGIRPLLSQLDNYKQPKEKWIVSYFDEDIHTIYDDDMNNIDNIPNILKLIDVKGHRTELWRSTQVAIKDLARRTSARKILVVMTDGEAEDTNAYTRSDVVKAANGAGIKIVTLGYRDTIGTQNLRRISEDTGGGFWKANKSTHKLPSNFYKEFMKLVKSSGIINIPSALIHPTETGKQDLNITFEYELNRSLLTITVDTEKIVSVEENTTVEEVIEVIEENTTAVAEDNITEEDNATKVEEEVKPKNFFEKYKLYLAILAALLALLLLYFLLRKKPIVNDEGNDINIPEADFSGETIVNSNMQSTASLSPVDDGTTMIHNANSANINSEPIAYLLASDGTKLNISYLPAKIGKSADNDVVISDKFMSRHHATLVNKNGLFYIIDNNSSNGIIVNGSKIIGEGKVSEGTHIYFGPYKTTFHIVKKSGNEQFGSDDEKTRWVK